MHMSDNSKYSSISHLMSEPVVLRTQQVVGAFAGEDITFEKIPDMPIDLLVQAQALDAVTLAALLAEPHLRDVADISDIAQNLPDDVVETLVRIKADFLGTGGEFVDHVVCDNPPAAKIRLAQHLNDMNTKEKTLVKADDEESYFLTCASTIGIAAKIIDSNDVAKFSPTLLQIYAQDLKKHADGVKTLDADCFADLDTVAGNIEKSAEALVEFVKKHEQDLQQQAEQAAEQTRFSQENPFPHPKSPFMRNKGRVKIVFKP